MIVLIIINVVLLLVQCWAEKGNFYITHINKTGMFLLKAGSPINTVGIDWKASAYYKNTVQSTGWDVLEVATNPVEPDVEQAFYAGWMEGYLMQENIYYHWVNTQKTFCDKIPATCDNIRAYLKTNMDWIEKNINQSQDDEYWHQVNLYYRQLKGLYMGYQQAALHKGLTDERLAYSDMLWINYVTDLMTLSESLANKTEAKLIDKSGHCSVLIKILPGFSDVLFAHNSWIGYNFMNRAIKRYNFPYHWSQKSTKRIPGQSQAFSSYAGVISSMDDFYIINSGLFVTETTNNVYNLEIYANNKPVGQVLESVRSVVANRLATSGESWNHYYSQRNSGTYNNQWMIVDLNKFKPGFEPQKGFLWVVEQMPGMIKAQDETDHIITQTYWASYNIPFYPEVYNYSGYDKMERKFGDYYSYKGCSRAKIFQREQNKVIDLKSMIETIRFNNYKTDPYSSCQQCDPQPNACMAVASRCDLNPQNGNYTLKGLKFNVFGAIDAKIGSYSLFKKGEMVSVAGPTWNDHVPPFQWSKAQTNNVSHFGQPDKWNFLPITTSWVQPLREADPTLPVTSVFVAHHRSNSSRTHHA